MSEKELKELKDENIEGVAGGYVSKILQNICCDVCQRKIGTKGGLPLSGGRHICSECLEKTKQVIGQNAMAEWLRKNG